MNCFVLLFILSTSFYLHIGTSCTRIYFHSWGSVFSSAKRLRGGVESCWRLVFPVLPKILDWESNLGTPGVSKSFQNPLPILIFFARLKKLLSNNFLSQLPISKQFGISFLAHWCVNFSLHNLIRQILLPCNNKLFGTFAEMLILESATRNHFFLQLISGYMLILQYDLSYFG